MVIRRDIYLNKLISKRHNGLIKVVTGVRRCGKSYLIFELFREYLKNDQVPELETNRILEFAEECVCLEGDFVELGCYKGDTSLLLTEVLVEKSVEKSVDKVGKSGGKVVKNDVGGKMRKKRSNSSRRTGNRSRN